METDPEVSTSVESLRIVQADVKKRSQNLLAYVMRRFSPEPFPAVIRVKK